MYSFGHCPSHSNKLLAWCMVLPLLLSCSSVGVYNNRNILDDDVNSIDQDINANDTLARQSGRNNSTVVVPRSIENALLPPLDITIRAADRVLMEARFDLIVDDAPAKDFFMVLVKDTPFNMVVHPSVNANISLKLKNVTVDQVMDVVRNVYGFEYIKSGTSYEVLANTLQSRIFKIDYLNVQRQGISQIRVSSGQISESGNESSNSNNKDNKKENKNDDSRNVVSGSMVDTYSNSHFWKELLDSLTAIVGDDDGRKVVVNPQSGIIIVRALPTQLREVEDYLKATQIVIQRQVILEAKILEIELSDGYQTGVNWSGLLKDGNNSAVIGQTGGGTIFNNGASEIAGNAGLLSPDNLIPIEGTVSSAFGGVFSLALNLNDFTAFIEALETQGDVHVLSSPRVSTVNNQKAVIKVGSDEFFVTSITTEETNNSNSNSDKTSVSVGLTPFFSGVALDVLPQIDDNGEVTLYIHPSVSEVTEKVKEITVNTDSGGTLGVPLALSTIRESDSIVRARSGQVIVIGGLMQNLTSDSTSGVPLLSKIPFIGGLFRHEKRANRKKELVILLKPVVVENDSVWNQFIGQSQSNFRDMSDAYSDGRPRSQGGN